MFCSCRRVWLLTFNRKAYVFGEKENDRKRKKAIKEREREGRGRVWGIHFYSPDYLMIAKLVWFGIYDVVSTSDKTGKGCWKKVDTEILRAAIIAELDAINLYEQFASTAEDKELKKVLLEVAREEKTHVGEFQALLLKMDKEQVEELEKGKKEVEELAGQ